MKNVIKNYGITIIIFGAMIGVGYYIYKENKKGIENDIKENWNN